MHQHLKPRDHNANRQPVSFTQEHPIGLAGGLNLNGFAAGDPVNLVTLSGCARTRWR